tara:strand:+ start:655 stop:795 length:141 start_codon:yes stop_codon:yes gene_type:complete
MNVKTISVPPEVFADIDKIAKANFRSKSMQIAYWVNQEKEKSTGKK